MGSKCSDYHCRIQTAKTYSSSFQEAGVKSASVKSVVMVW